MLNNIGNHSYILLTLKTVLLEYYFVEDANCPCFFYYLLIMVFLGFVFNNSLGLKFMMQSHIWHQNQEIF